MTLSTKNSLRTGDWTSFPTPLPLVDLFSQLIWPKVVILVLIKYILICYYDSGFFPSSSPTFFVQTGWCFIRITILFVICWQCLRRKLCRTHLQSFPVTDQCFMGATNRGGQEFSFQVLQNHFEIPTTKKMKIFKEEIKIILFFRSFYVLFFLFFGHERVFFNSLAVFLASRGSSSPHFILTAGWAVWSALLDALNGTFSA